MSAPNVVLTHSMTGATVRKLAVSSDRPAAGAEAIGRRKERRDVGPPEAVDGLLRVAHHEKVPGRHLHLRPMERRQPASESGIGGRDAHGQLDLDGIGVLELVEQESLVAFVQAGPHHRSVLGITQERPGEHQQIVELQLPGPLAARGRWPT